MNDALKRDSKHIFVDVTWGLPPIDFIYCIDFYEKGCYWKSPSQKMERKGKNEGKKVLTELNRSKRDEPVLPGDLLSIRSYHEIYELLSAGRRLSPGVEIEVTMQRIRSILYVLNIGVNTFILQCT